MSGSIPGQNTASEAGDHPDPPGNGSSMPKLTLAALGVVYGDIGTSPLYAVRDCFFGANPVAVTPADMLGVLSLIFWSLVLVISVKYLLVVMRADNNGEGGILALLALIDPWRHGLKYLKRPMSKALILLGIFGAALLFGDGMLTPAISVLSAVEGLQIAAPHLGHLVIPITIAILILLFLFQKRGTAKVGSLFGPIIIVWFVVLAALGIASISANPQVLKAVNPWLAVSLFLRTPQDAFLVLGGVFLVVTGGEALYADMGHFGSRPIRLAWFGLVLPALVLNYFGQGAYILAHPVDAVHPFYNLVPGWGVYPMIALATVVTVIASQAVISGTFSLTRQAIQLHQSPPLRVVQTSPEEIGQIYVPFMNWLLFTGTVALVIGFGTSADLASAYGVAVSTTMVITTMLAYFIMRDHWHWSRPLRWTVTAAFLVSDLAFFGANLSKIVEGGWFPLAVGGIALLLMLTWDSGNRLYHSRISQRYMSIEDFITSLKLDMPQRIPGTAVFLTGSDLVPGGLLHHLKLNQVLHEQVLLLTVVTEDIPRVAANNRLEVKALPCGFYRVYVRYGFMQNPNIPVALKLCDEQKLIPDLEPDMVTYYADRATLVVTDDASVMRPWRKRLYCFMVRNSQRVMDFYDLPSGRSVELGIQVEI